MRGVDGERKGDNRHGNCRRLRWGKAEDFEVNCPPSMTDEMDASAAEKLDTESVQGSMIAVGIRKQSPRGLRPSQGTDPDRKIPDKPERHRPHRLKL